MLETLSIPLAVLAYTILSTGLVLMKKGIAWIGHKGRKDRAYRRHQITWFSGFLLINLSIVPNALALKHLEPHIVSAFAGWGVAVMVFLAYKILGERLFRSDYWNTFFIVLAIIVLNFFERRDAQETVRVSFFIAAAVFPFALLLLVFIRNASNKVRALLFAATAGMSTGMIIVTVKVMVSLFGFQVSAYFASPYLYVYLVFSLAAFGAMQIAYKMGNLLAVGPVQYAAAILYPVLCTAVVFSNRLHPVQLIAFAVIVFAVVSLLRKH